MSVTLAGQVLEFVSNEKGDDISTGPTVLDSDKPPFFLRVRWMPVMEVWVMTVVAQGGVAIVSDVPVLYQEDVMANVVSSDRPAGAIVAITRDKLDPGRDAWTTGGRLVYFPEGLGALVADAAGGLL